MSFPAIAAAGLSLLMLILYPEAAREAVVLGLKTCGETIIPSLFPFFVAVNLISELGVITKILSVFKVKSPGIAAFLIGIVGGYPVGAAYISEAAKRGDISSDEASRLIVWCNNSGPAFIIGAVGSGVFGSHAAGFILYGAHVASAAMYGKLFCSGGSVSYSPQMTASVKFSEAFILSVKKSVSAIINVCGFIIAFSVILSMLNTGGLINLLSGKISELFGAELKLSRALLTGILEIGNSIFIMQDLSLSPANLSVAAFILGWGGISVHFQTLSLVSDTDIKTARYIIGRFIIALFSALMSYFAAVLFKI